MTTAAALTIPADQLSPNPEIERGQRGYLRHRDATQMRAQLQDPAEVYMDGAVRRWVCNDRCVPRSCFGDALMVLPQVQLDAIQKETAALLDEYRASQPDQPNKEERRAARAVHGPGVVIVNVITGRRFTT